MEIALQSYLEKHVSGVAPKAAQSVLDLVGEGATVPFIARYRKEKTGGLDEVEIRAVISAAETFQELEKRRKFVLQEIESQGNLTAELKTALLSAADIGEVDELYRPFKKKRKTKATQAREAGLEPLANWIWALGHDELEDATTLEVKAKEFLNIPAGIATYDLALKGAQDILVERLSNSPALRESVRRNFMEHGQIVSKKAKQFKAHSKFEMYGDHSEPVKGLFEKKASHRYLAMKRGWGEEELTVVIQGEDEHLLSLFERAALTKLSSHAAEFLKLAAKVAYTGHVHPSISNEVHRLLKEKADQHAVEVFAENVRRVLLASPFGPRCVLGVDPGIRTGCKIALIDKQGNFVSHTVLQLQGEGAEERAKALFGEVLKQIQVDAIAVGNGTGGREAERFLRKVLKELESNTPVVMVSETGASVYSASDVAREEFPDLDLTVRGAISIARRLQDPLAELVKIDPKSIGVGQYQHDVSAAMLKKSLEAVVESCVNSVGIDLNTASAPLLSHVAGIGPQLAQNIVEFRKSSGLFEERDQLLKVPRFSGKVYEQCAGFLRIRNGRIQLDATGIHPERYQAVRDMAQEAGVPISQLVGEGVKKLIPLEEKWKGIVGEFTFKDILRELEKPGRDPRDTFKPFSFREDLNELTDVKEGMTCPGIVSNVTNFGAFVDIGVHQDGLVHISELSTQFIDDPRKVVNPGDQVTVRVLGVDLDKKQLSLSMVLDPAARRERAPTQAPREPRERPPRSNPAEAGANRRPPRGEGAGRPPRPQQQRPPRFRDGEGAPPSPRPEGVAAQRQEPPSIESENSAVQQRERAPARRQRQPGDVARSGGPSKFAPAPRAGQQTGGRPGGRGGPGGGGQRPQFGGPRPNGSASPANGDNSFAAHGAEAHSSDRGPGRGDEQQRTPRHGPHGHQGQSRPGGGGGFGGGRPQQGGGHGGHRSGPSHRPPAAPFNNPFAALLQTTPSGDEKGKSEKG